MIISISWPELNIRIPHFFITLDRVCVYMCVCVWMGVCVCVDVNRSRVCVCYCFVWVCDYIFMRMKSF